MKISLIAVGKLKRGPERELVSDYIKRAARLGPSLGIREVKEIEIDAGGSQEQECERILAKLPDGARVILLDETGKARTSTAFSEHLATLRDQGCSDLAFIIGGADGFTAAMKDAHKDKLSFGQLTWPHKLVRALAAEQLYRALSLMAGTPYHRE